MTPSATTSPKPLGPGLALAVPILLLILVFQLAWGLVIQGLGTLPLESELWLLGAGNLASLFLGAGVLVLILRRKAPRPLTQLLNLTTPTILRPALFVPGLLLSAAGATVVLGEAGNWITFLLPMPDSLVKLFQAFLSLQAPAATLVLLMAVAPLTEEVVFRGLLLSGFRRRYGPAAALVMTSALFALFHMNPWQAPAALVAGFYLAWVTLGTGSLYPALVFHSLFNGLPVLLALGGLRIEGYNTPPAANPSFMPPVLLTFGAVLTAFGGLLTAWGLKKRKKES